MTYIKDSYRCSKHRILLFPFMYTYIKLWSLKGFYAVFNHIITMTIKKSRKTNKQTKWISINPRVSRSFRTHWINLTDAFPLTNSNMQHKNEANGWGLNFRVLRLLKIDVNDFGKKKEKLSTNMRTYKCTCKNHCCCTVYITYKKMS